MRTAVFMVPGVPVGKGRPKFRRRGAYVQTYTPDRTASYENLIKISYPRDVEIMDGPVKAYIKAIFPVPKSTSGKKTKQMLSGEIKYTKKPDLDNVIKSILDAINGIAYRDDSQVIEISATKEYGEEPRVEVVLIEVDQ